ncbi:MAG: hypothetical protein JNM85_06575 [Chthonomonas sp.]|nr:hypothetical protein [Chthonomonas sp.]
MERIFAAADIGSNTCHLLVAGTDGKTIRRIANESDWLSLGEIVSRERVIPAPLANRLIATLRRYKRLATTSNAERLYVFATEAMRLAENHEEIMARLRREVGIEVDLISGEVEARYSVRGVSQDCPGEFPALLVEVGGGSAQVAHYSQGSIQHELSLPLGSGRLIAETGLESPAAPAQIRSMHNLIDREIEFCSSFPPVRRVVASGGIARGLIRALHPDGERTLNIVEIDYVAWAAARLDVEQIMARFGVKFKRASTLLPGASVIRALLHCFRQHELMVSEHGVREGAIFQMYEGSL